MAEEKESKSTVGNFEIIAGEITGLILVLYFIFRLLDSFNAGGGLGRFAGLFERLKIQSIFGSIFSFSLFFSGIVSVLCVFGIVYCLFRLHKIEVSWRAVLHPPVGLAEAKRQKNERWVRVVAHLKSDNPSDWRLAVLESDIVLDELLDKLGVIGDTMGDKLKSIDPAHFKTLNNAWEAHKIRNAIAHEGQDFALTEREARRIISLYESVFKEFDFIGEPLA